MRPYNPLTDYEILRESQRPEMSIHACALALRAHNIFFPSNWNYDQSPASVAIDRDLLKAWKELGHRNN